LKSVPRWHTGWTPASYLSFSLASGGVLATLFSAFNGDAGLWLPLLAALLVAAAWAIKFRWRERARNLRQESTPETATGLGNIGKVRLFEPPHMTENYLTREMGFVVARKHAVKLFRIAFALGAAIPFILMILTAMADRGTGGILLSLTAALCLAVGLLVDRWLFFAEARHVVMNYYGK
jgi:DMSO reductase anchor subunit